MKTPTSLVALIHGPAEHYLDHLAPLCALWKVPLAVTDETIASLARDYYPMVELIVLDPHSFAFTLTQEFDTVLTTLARPLVDELFFTAKVLLAKEIKTIWCPHGNSDKGHASLFMEALAQETHALVYGQKMIDFLKAKGSYAQLKKIECLGNYRKKFADEHAPFYRSLVEEKILSKLKKGNKTILFAPTWEDAENSSSFFAGVCSLIDELPEKFNLIIKPHPNLKWQRGGIAYELLSSYATRANLLILWDFPPIYPLLDAVDIYIGDNSSIGYDFLSFNRPMFFLNQTGRDPLTDPGLYLYRCGREVRPEDFKQIYTIIEQETGKPQKLSAVRKEVYTYCFESKTVLHEYT